MKSALPWIVRVLALVALVLSGFLWWSSATTEAVVGCNAFSGFDCQAALGSPWAKWFGLPVAAGGTLCYLAAFVGALLAPRSNSAGSIGWRLLEVATPLAVGAGIWFTIVQSAFLESFCLYCLVTHLCGIAMAVAIVLWRHAESGEAANPAAVGLSFDGNIAAVDPPGPPALGIPSLLGTLGVIALVVGQTLFAPSRVLQSEPELEEAFRFNAKTEITPAETNSSDSSQDAPVEATVKENKAPLRRAGGSREITLLNGQLRIDTYSQAVLGSPDAPHIVVEMMDYACQHCREFHEKLTEALERFDGQVAVVVMPVPGEISCNPYVTKARKTSAGACYAAKLSMAVSRLEPEQFEAFHHWMLQAESIPSRTAALIAARERVDGNDLSDAIRDTEGVIAGRIKQYVELAGVLSRQGKFGLPTQILGNRVIAGPPETVDAVCELWSEAFDIELPSEAIPF